MGCFSAGSKESQSTSQTTVNEQVALQGDGQIGRIEAAGNVSASVHISDGSDIAIYSGRDVALQAVQSNEAATADAFATVQKLSSDLTKRAANDSVEKAVAFGAASNIAEQGAQLARSVVDASTQAIELTTGSLERSTQELLDVNRDVSARAISETGSVSKAGLALAESVQNSAHQSVIQTLAALRDLQRDASETVRGAVGAAQQTALLATPQNPAAYAEIIGAQGAETQKQYVMLAVAGILVVGLTVYFAKK